MRETELYAPVKAFLESQGYEVKAEVHDCDLVAIRGAEEPVIVELKTTLSLALLMQGVDRQTISDWVYLAVPVGKGPRWRGQVKTGVKLCRRLGLGLISVRTGRAATVEVHADPGPYQPRKNTRRKGALLREFQARVGDPNTGGQTRQKVVTAYRQDALRLAVALKAGHSGKPAALKRDLGVARAALILQKDYYGWFCRIERGVYGLSDQGLVALETYEGVVDTLEATADLNRD